MTKLATTTAVERDATPAPRSGPSRTALRRAIRELARAFGEQLLGLLEEQGLFREPARAPEREDEVAAPRRYRRTRGALEVVLSRVLAELGRRETPVSIGVLAAALGVETRILAHPLSLLVEQGKVERTGERRGARYELVRRAVGRARRNNARVPARPTPRNRNRK